MEEEQEHEKKPFFLKRIYEKKYKLLLIIPLVLLILSLAQIGMQYSQTGEFLNKGVSLKGGITISIEKSTNIEIDPLPRDFI